MNLNTETIRLQAATELNQGFAAGELAFMGDSTYVAYATALFHPAELTEAQIGQVCAYNNNAMMSAQNTWIAYQAGLASEQSWSYARRMAATEPRRVSRRLVGLSHAAMADSSD